MSPLYITELRYFSPTPHAEEYNAVCVLNSIIAVLCLCASVSCGLLEFKHSSSETREKSLPDATHLSSTVYQSVFVGVAPPPPHSHPPYCTSHPSAAMCSFWFTGGQDDHSPQGLRAPIYSPLYDHIKKAKCSGVPD